jgi:hypothetical protein
VSDMDMHSMRDAAEFSLQCFMLAPPMVFGPLRGMVEMIDWKPREHMILESSDVCMSAIAKEWDQVGRPRFVLSESMAALMASTRAPCLAEHELPLPYDVTVIEVPPSWTSMNGTGPLIIICSRTSFGDTPDAAVPALLVLARRTGIDGENQGTVARMILEGERLNEAAPMKFCESDDDGEMMKVYEREAGTIKDAPAYFIETMRYLVNTVCFLSAHRECAVKRTGKNAPRNAALLDVTPPRDVVVTSQFRTLSKQLITGRSIGERKQALMHIVRGHWRNQVCGEKRASRQMKWIAPHMRGANVLGRVVEKAVTL